MNKNAALGIGLAAWACGLALVSRARNEASGNALPAGMDPSPQPDETPRAVADSRDRQAQAPAAQLPTPASASPLIVLLGSGFVCVAIGLAAISKYVTSRSA